MNRRWWGSLLLLGLALALGTLIFRYERLKPAPPPAPSPDAARPLLERPQAVVSLRLQNPQGQFTFVREGPRSPWRMTEPIAGAVEPIFVTLMGKKFLELDQERTVAEGDRDLAKFGLSDPAGRVTYRFEDGEEDVVLELGKLNPIQNKLYARRAGRPEIFLVDRIVYQFLFRGLDDFRLHWLLATMTADAVSLEIRYQDPALQRTFRAAYSARLATQTDPRGQIQWMMLEPFHEPVATDAVEGIVDGMHQSLEAQVVEGGLAHLERFGLDRPALEVSVERNDHTLEQVRFSRPTPDGKLFYAYHPGWDLLFQVTAAKMSKVFNRDLRTLYLLPPGGEGTFNRLAVSFPREHKPGYALAKSPAGAWLLDGSRQSPAESVNPAWVVEPLVMIPGKSFYVYQRNPDLGAYGLAEPRAVIQFYEEGREIANVAIGSATAQPNGCYVLDRQRDALLWISNDIYPRIPPDQDVFLRRKAPEPTTSQ
jgi:hypothetical protein